MPDFLILSMCECRFNVSLCSVEGREIAFVMVLRLCIKIARFGGGAIVRVVVFLALAVFFV